MNYKKIYKSLTERGKSRNLIGYTEIHHIIPRCIGGKDDPSNLVKLTPEEHYIAHLLLLKIYPNEPKLVYAANMMANRMQFLGYTNKKYGIARRAVSKVMKERIISNETKKKISKIQIGKTHSKETREKMSKSHKGKVFSKEHRQKISENQKLKSQLGTHNLIGLSRKKVQEGTHHWLGKNPWESNRTTSDSLKAWKLAPKIISIFEEHKSYGKKIGSIKISKIIETTEKPIRTVIKKYKNGWNPLEDESWKTKFNN
jgi:hypothetical protein